MLLETVVQLEEALTAPSPALVRDLAAEDSDLVVLGAGGKMGPTLALLAHRAMREAGAGGRVLAVARFSDGAARAWLDAAGVTTIAADLLDSRTIAGLPDAARVVYMLGTKFGTSGNESGTWAANAYVPGRVAERYAGSRIVAFSSGNVYPFLPTALGGATEKTPPAPVGEYAQSCLARERIFEHFSRATHTPVAIYRLNYAIDLRYGVLLDVARAVARGEQVNLGMGSVNVIWQGDANEIALRALNHAAVPPAILNVTGPETVSVRWLAEQFGRRFGIEPTFIGEEAPTALLNNAAAAFGLFGYPKVTLTQMIEWVARWIEIGGPMYGKPTHFQERKGTF